jgi:hypothetical protein
MIKTLKVVSILVAMCALGSVVFVVVLGIQGDQQIEELLKAPGAIEEFRKLAKTPDESEDQVSPLVRHAKDFSLRINPPPPPKPKPPEAAPTRRVARKETPTPPSPKAPVRAKFKLLATCRYKQQPGRSLALLDMPAKGIKWYRQGDGVGHLTIQEVKDGSVVCSDGQELFVPPTRKKTKTLLKSELADSRRPQASISTPLEVVESVVGTVDLAAQETQPVTAPGRPGRQSQPGDASGAKPESDSAKRRRIRHLPARKPRGLPPEPTPEQKKEMLTESITTVREMMANPTPSLTDEEKAAELKIWERMLEGLEKERAEIENSGN